MGLQQDQSQQISQVLGKMCPTLLLKPLMWGRKKNNFLQVHLWQDQFITSLSWLFYTNTLNNCSL